VTQFASTHPASTHVSIHNSFIHPSVHSANVSNQTITLRNLHDKHTEANKSLDQHSPEVHIPFASLKELVVAIVKV
jgi:hypothetical protein